MKMRDQKRNHRHHNVGHHPRCPEHIPASVPDDHFASPFPCPNKIPTPRFSAPTSASPPEETRSLEECIEEVNHLLLTLALRTNPNLNELRQRFRHLRKVPVRVEIECGKRRIELSGVFVDAGLNFIIIRSKKGEKTMIPLQRICTVKHNQTEVPHHHQPELTNISRKLRRKLVLNFGEVVSQSPLLINIFFGISLELFLLCFIKQMIRVHVNEISSTIEGVLLDARDGQIELEIAGEKRNLNMDDICFIELMDDEMVDDLWEEKEEEIDPDIILDEEDFH